MREIGAGRSEGPAAEFVGRIDEAAGRTIPPVGWQGENGAQSVLERFKAARASGFPQFVSHVFVHMSPELEVERDESPVECAIVQGAQCDAVIGAVGTVRMCGRQDMRAIEKS